MAGSQCPTLNCRLYLDKTNTFFPFISTSYFKTFSYCLTFYLLFKMSGVTTRSSGSKKTSSTTAKPNPKSKANANLSTSKTVANTSSTSSKGPKSSLSPASYSSTTSNVVSTTNSRAGSATPSNRSQPLNPQEDALLKALLKRSRKSIKSTQEDLHKGMQFKLLSFYWLPIFILKLK